MALDAYHVNWSKPAMIDNDEYSEKPFSLMTMVLSALKWRENNGGIKLYTDKPCYDYYDSLDLLPLWDRGVDTEAMDNIPNSIKPDVFFAAGKFYGLENEPLGNVCIDRDIIAWKDISHKIGDNKLTVAHREPVGYNFGYIPQEKLVSPAGYEFEEDLNWDINPCNTSVMSIQDPEFKRRYLKNFKEYTIGNNDSKLKHDIVVGNYVAEILFVEQRYIAMLADKMDIEINQVIGEEILYNNWGSIVYDEEDLLTHIWSFKKDIDKKPRAKEWLTRRLLKRIYDDHPKYFNILLKHFPELNEYLDNYFMRDEEKIDINTINTGPGVALDLI